MSSVVVIGAQWGDVGIAPYIYYVKIMDNFVKTIAKNKNILYNIYYQ